MHRLVSILILALIGLNAGSTLGAAAPKQRKLLEERYAPTYRSHLESQTPAEAKPVIYLFGETHGTPQAREQKNILTDYAAQGRILLAHESLPLILESNAQKISPYQDPNEIGSENSLMLAVHNAFASLDHYYTAVAVSRQGGEAQMGRLLSEARKRLNECLIMLGYPDSKDLFEYLASSGPQALKEHAFFADLTMVYPMMSNMSEVADLNEFSTQLMAGSHVLVDYVFLKDYDLQGQFIFMRLLGHGIIGYLLDRAALPEDKKVDSTFIEASMALVYEWDAELADRFLPECSNSRDLWIAHNLEQIYTMPDTHHAPLVGVYGKLHIPSLKAKLEAKGFEVIADDMVALDAAIANRRVKDEL